MNPVHSGLIYKTLSRSSDSNRVKGSGLDVCVISRHVGISARKTVARLPLAADDFAFHSHTNEQ